MPEQIYPVFYGTQRMTLVQIRARFQPGCHPEVWRCVEALLVWGRGRWGIGGGRRLVQPDKPGFAPAGMSFHEWQEFQSGLVAYSAFDFVMTNPGGVHRSPTWEEARELPQFGLWAFITGEPWHGQRKLVKGGVLIRGYRSWVAAGRPDPDPFSLPGQPQVPPVPPLGSGIPYTPPSSWWLFPLDPAKPRLEQGMVDADVIGHIRYAQDAIWHGAGGDIHRDGYFGPEMARRTGDVQRTFGLDEDEVIGPKTWAVIDFLVALVLDPTILDPEPAPENTGVTQASPCLYWVRHRDNPWRVGERVYGSGRMGADLLDPDLFNSWDKHIAIPQVAGLSTAVREGEGTIAVTKRMTGDRNDHAAFLAWNGGTERTLHPGELVHVPI